MKYCVIKNTTTVIDGSENIEEVMLKNAESAGVDSSDIEILSEEDYQARVDSLPVKILVPTLAELNRSDIDYIAVMTGVDL